MKDETYKGWTNWDTWNVFTLLSNNEGIYNKATKCEAEGDLLDLACTYKLVNVFTQDLVNWNEISEGFKE